ncbi:hypothetical protein E3T28_01420 [Cryobacterium sinapicolor]|uniref:Isoprenylcysteine carboxylmethyltransferase family protein n=1 Tax=Cryobacterium sinapicolor TaxID=1259236 RepID=A0ABY2JG42_9MICO|nr:hypothetical protein [Cryobacterium sinapicolor]TFD05006.1 hypothetical protein E3T28_01420 [Cryobacterium sinapicolor]
MNRALAIALVSAQVLLLLALALLPHGGLWPVNLGGSVWHLVAWLALLLLLAGKARWEERMLVAEHPDYAPYGTRVGRFLPGVGRLKP